MKTPTDPYGSLTYVIGTEDDFWCFDYYVHADKTITLHAVINSETGGFIQDAEPPVRLPFAEAVDYAQDLVNQAQDWLCESGEPLEHDETGWNQKPEKFVEAVRKEIR